MDERAWREPGYPFLRNWQGEPLRIIRAWRCESTMPWSGQTDQNQQKSAYLHKLAWQWTKIVDEDCTFFRITFHRSTVTDAPVSATTEEKEEKPLRYDAIDVGARRRMLIRVDVARWTSKINVIKLMKLAWIVKVTRKSFEDVPWYLINWLTCKETFTVESKGGLEINRDNLDLRLKLKREN